MKFKILLILLVSFLNFASGIGNFGTKTPYIFDALTNQMKTPIGYKAVKIWGMIRHGSRYPSKEFIANYNELKKTRDEIVSKNKLLNESQIEALKSWTPFEIKPEEEKFLSETGGHELYGIGSRIRDKFPHFIQNSLSNFTFKHTPTQRTELSAANFIDGLFSTNSTDKIKSIKVAKDDLILRPYKACPAWKLDIKKNKSVSLKEKYLMEKSDFSLKVIDDFFQLTGTKSTIQDLETIFTLCGFETSWKHQLFNGESIWCSLFSEDNMKVLEYLKDLEYYWIDGPGFDITRKICCNTVGDMLNRLNPNSNETPFNFYFSHSGTVLKLLTFLNLYDDNFDLTAEKFSSNEVDHRKWRTSFIDKFATNIFAVLYQSIETQEYYIQLYHQEKIVNIPNCQLNESQMCKFKDFKNLYQDKVKECNLKNLCKIKDEF